MNLLIIVLGAMAPHLLNLRIDTAVGLWKESSEEKTTIILSGHQKKPAATLEATESVRMLRGMRSRWANLPRENVLLEHRSNNTAQNAVCSLLRAQSACITFTEVVVVTNAFHVRRAREIFKRVWGDAFHLTFRAAPDPPDVKWRKRLEDDVLYAGIGADVAEAWKFQERCGGVEAQCVNV